MAKKQPIGLDLAPPPPPFEGFDAKTVTYLSQLKKNNTKLWFDAHRNDYELHLREPSRLLVNEMAMRFSSESIPLIADIKRSLFRINRDIRFSIDKSPYKTHIGIVFPMPELAQDEWAGMYFSIEPKTAKQITSSAGGGIYMPSPVFLKQVRERITSNFKQFQKLNSDKAFRKHYPAGITGASLVRMPKGFDEDDPAADFLKLKEFLFSAPLEQKEVLSKDLPKILTARFKAAMPMLEFLSGKDVK